MSDAIGFIGIGAMGWLMARNIRLKTDSSTSLCIYDVSQTILEKFAQDFSSSGPIKICSSAQEVAQLCSRVITMVPEGKHVEQVYLAKNGICSSDYADKLFIDCSTIDVATSSKVSNSIYPKASFFDAPCSGGTMNAEKASLTFMVGIAEDSASWPAVKELLSLVGTNFFACGGPGKGLATKLSNNYLSGLIAIATSEAMSIGQAHGLDPKVLSDVFKTSTAGSWVNSNCNPVPGVSPTAPPSNKYQGGFKVGLMRKDFNLAVEAARRQNVNLALGEKGLDVFTKASQDPRYTDMDARVVYKYLRNEEV